jgi:replicative superfamily II helicase
MVDFKKRLKQPTSDKPIDPVALYDSLDRASDKGPLRPAQSHVLSEWHTRLRSKRDLIVKLHTGQGKTLIGLVMLQSRLNEGAGPALYLCPNTFLVNQTCEQAKQFGIATVQADDGLPDSFVSGKAVLVTTVQKLFNGKTRFGLGTSSHEVGTLLMDDCHACVDAIKQACSIVLKSTDEPYKQLVALFDSDLRHQGAGSYADILNGEYDALLPVPYWAWQDHVDSVTSILSASQKLDAIRFAWPLLRDRLTRCQCIVSGAGIEIVPFVPPLHLFGSYSNAKYRVFMSATVTDDSFLIKGLGLDADTILHPVIYPKEKWCGEKMILVPSLIDSALTRDKLLPHFAKANPKRRYGVVALCPSFKCAEPWAEHGAEVTSPEKINEQVQTLREAKTEKTLAIVNRYDGVDLPDDACRILILDSRPPATSLLDRYLEAVRPGSDILAQRTARTIEQGLGRSVRGEKDYCAVVLLGSDLVQAVRSPEVRKFYSSQTNTQIEIGNDIAEYAKEDIASGVDPASALAGLIKKVLDRDDGWKEFYVERMSKVPPETPNKRLLDIYAVELESEKYADMGQYDQAAKVMQTLLDGSKLSSGERGWYLQELARQTYQFSKVEAEKVQVSAHKSNMFLLRPKDGMVVKRLEVAQKRAEAISKWIARSESYAHLMVRVDAILSDLRFGVEAERFERAFDELGAMLGFSTQRPDKEWKEGPDNLWCLDVGQYLLAEAKSKVESDRDEIYKSESGQMNNACGWFANNYSGSSTSHILIHPAKKLGAGAAFNCPVQIMRSKELKALCRTVRAFAMEFSAAKLDNLSGTEIQKWVTKHGLDISSLLQNFSVPATD